MKPDISDFLIILGIGLIGLGAYLIYPPAAALIIGLFLLLVGLLGARAAAIKKEKREAEKSKGGEGG